jgi:poly-beta-1,6-N-acetyl-D-glucosamine synthase
MLFLKYVFYISLFIVFYNYAGYAIIIYVLNLFKKKKKQWPPEDYFPSISFIVAAYNEEECIEKKIINSLQQNYPSDKIEFIFVTDGSTDASPDIIRSYPNIQLLHSAERKGKTSALNRAVQSAKNEVLIFSDANTVLNPDACKKISRHYYHASVGGVAGEKKVITLSDDNANAANSEGFYWKYESYLKKLDSDFHTVVGAAGELFSVRKNLYEPVAPEVILDDFIISMKIAQKGYRIAYEPEAFAMELPSFSIEDEKKRKVRISAGGFQSIVILKEALYFWKHFKLTFLYISHRVLRWTLSPVCLILAFVSNGILAVYYNNTLYYVLFLMQLAFYFAALASAVYPSLGKKSGLFRLTYYFVFMNVSVCQGFLKFMQKGQSSAWEKARRSSFSVPEIKA